MEAGQGAAVVQQLQQGAVQVTLVFQLGADCTHTKGEGGGKRGGRGSGCQQRLKANSFDLRVRVWQGPVGVKAWQWICAGERAWPSWGGAF